MPSIERYRACIVFVQEGNRFNDEALRVISNVLKILKVFTQKDEPPSDLEVQKLNPDLVINFLCERIHRGEVLRRPNINFHPGLPEYPGRGGASLALFDGCLEYGATAHRMIQSVDAGEILLVHKFRIKDSDLCSDIYAKAEGSCLHLVKEFIRHLALHDSFPPSLDVRWARKPTTRKDFQAWLVLDPSKPDEFVRKIRASLHPSYPGPYVIHQGSRYAFKWPQDLNLDQLPRSLDAFLKHAVLVGLEETPSRSRARQSHSLTELLDHDIGT